MREEKNLARIMALLALAKSEDENAEAAGGADACLDLEEIAAMIKPAKPEPAKPEPAKPEPAKPEPAKPGERLSWEQRRRLTRHLAACPECYRLWLEVARQTAGPPPRRWPSLWPWPRLSFKTFAYTGGALATAAACLLLFLHPPQLKRQMNVTSSPPPAPTVSPAKPAPSAATREMAAAEPEPSVVAREIVAAKPAAPSTAAKEMATAKDESLAAGRARGKTEPQAEPLAAQPVQSAEGLAEKPAEKRDGSISIGAAEERRSTDRLTVWYGDLRELCRQSPFVPAQWTSLYTRGAEILEALPEDGEGEEIDRLWLILGQLEGLTADRRKNFCAWSEKELVRKLEKKRR